MPLKHSDCHPLIVDDDQEFTLLLKRTLERVGVPRSNICTCQDGEEALKFLSDGPHPPSFILLDLHMPKRTGLQVLEWIRSHSSPLAEVQVFMLTSSSDSDHVVRAFELGVGSYFIKPMDIHALEGILEGIVAYWERRSTALVRGSLHPPRR